VRILPGSPRVKPSVCLTRGGWERLKAYLTERNPSAACKAGRAFGLRYPVDRVAQGIKGRHRIGADRSRTSYCTDKHFAVFSSQRKPNGNGASYLTPWARMPSASPLSPSPNQPGSKSVQDPRVQQSSLRCVTRHADPRETLVACPLLRRVLPQHQHWDRQS
jgi:hypothetical protein